MKLKYLLAIVLPLFMSCQFNAPELTEFKWGSAVKVDCPSGLSGYAKYFPDGKFNLVQKDGQWQMFWGERSDFLTVAATPWIEDHYSQIKDSNIVYGGGKIDPVTGFSDNGAWFIGVHPLDESGKYVGFYHGESWWSGDSQQRAYKSIGVSYSDDYGKTWKSSSPIIVDSKTKTKSPEWSGLGDGCVIWDSKKSRWLCYYQGKEDSSFDKGNYICMASSNDPNGASGTWKKWNGKEFSNAGYNSSSKVGGANVAIDNLKKVPGANPSVMWNESLGQYMMAYHSWEGEIYMSFSKDGVEWELPKHLFKGIYPNMISEQGDKTCSKNFRLYYAPELKSDGTRNICYVELKPAE